MSELLIVAIISLSIGAVIGSFASVPVSNKLLENEISNSQSEYDDISKNFGIGAPSKPSENTTTEENNTENETVSENTTENNTIDENSTNETSSSSKSSHSKEEKYNFNVANVEEIDSIDAVVDFKVLAELLGIGIALTLLSSLASMIAISRFSPLTILKERS